MMTGGGGPHHKFFPGPTAAVSGPALGQIPRPSTGLEQTPRERSDDRSSPGRSYADASQLLDSPHRRLLSLQHFQYARLRLRPA